MFNDSNDPQAEKYNQQPGEEFAIVLRQLVSTGIREQRLKHSIVIIGL